jgi:hypothetical protein
MNPVIKPIEGARTARRRLLEKMIPIDRQEEVFAVLDPMPRTTGFTRRFGLIWRRRGSEHRP